MADLAALLDKEASAEIEAILSEARTRASEIVAQAEEEAQRIIAQRKHALASQHDASLVRAKSAAQLEAASLKLRSQHQAVEAVFDEVENRLNALVKNEKEYEPVFTNLLKEAFESVGGKTTNVASVIVNPDDKALAEKATAELSLKSKLQTDASVRGGVKLRGNNKTSIENSLFERLESLRDELASEVSETLFADTSGA